MKTLSLSRIGCESTLLFHGITTIVLFTTIILMVIGTAGILPPAEDTEPELPEGITLHNPCQPPTEPISQAVKLLWQLALFLQAVLVIIHLLLLIITAKTRKPIDRHWTEYPLSLLGCLTILISSVICSYLYQIYTLTCTDAAPALQTSETLGIATTILAFLTWLIIMIRDAVNSWHTPEEDI